MELWDGLGWRDLGDPLVPIKLIKEGPAPVAVGLELLQGASGCALAVPSLTIPGAIPIFSIPSPAPMGSHSPLGHPGRAGAASLAQERRESCKTFLIFPFILDGVLDFQFHPGLSKYFDCTQVRT